MANAAGSVRAFIFTAVKYTPNAISESLGGWAPTPKPSADYFRIVLWTITVPLVSDKPVERPCSTQRLLENERQHLSSCSRFGGTTLTQLPFSVQPNDASPLPQFSFFPQVLDCASASVKCSEALWASATLRRSALCARARVARFLGRSDSGFLKHPFLTSRLFSDSMIVHAGMRILIESNHLSAKLRRSEIAYSFDVR